MMDSSGSTGVRFVAIIIAIASGCQATDPTAGVMNGARDVWNGQRGGVFAGDESEPSNLLANIFGVEGYGCDSFVAEGWCDWDSSALALLCPGRCVAKEDCIDDPRVCSTGSNPDCSDPSIALVCPRTCKIPSCTFDAPEGPLTCADENRAVGAIWGALRQWHCNVGAIPPPSPPPPSLPRATHCTPSYCDSSMFVPTETGQCFCEASCEIANDCCPDYHEQCRGETTQAATTTTAVMCAGQCSQRDRDSVGFAGLNGCACDLDCVQQGDCCPDFTNECISSDANQLFVCNYDADTPAMLADCTTAAALYGCSSLLVKTLCPKTCGNTDCTTTTSTTSTVTTATVTSTTTSTATKTTATGTSTTTTTTTATATTTSATTFTGTYTTATETTSSATTTTATTKTATTTTTTTKTSTTKTATTATRTTVTATTTSVTSATSTITTKTATTTTTASTTTSLGRGMLKKEALELSFLANNAIATSAARTSTVSVQIQAAVVVAAALANFPEIERGIAVVDQTFRQRLIFTIVFRGGTSTADVESLAETLKNVAPFFAETAVGTLTAFDAIRVERTELGTTTATVTSTTTDTFTITTTTTSTATETTGTETTVTGTTITNTSGTTTTTTITTVTTTTNTACQTSENEAGEGEANNCACYRGENCMATPFASFYDCSNCCNYVRGCFAADMCRYPGATGDDPNPTVCNRGKDHEICGEDEVAVGTCGTGCMCVAVTTPTTTATDNDKLNDDIDDDGTTVVDRNDVIVDLFTQLEPTESGCSQVAADVQNFCANVPLIGYVCPRTCASVEPTFVLPTAEDYRVNQDSIMTAAFGSPCAATADEASCAVQPAVALMCPETCQNPPPACMCKDVWAYDGAEFNGCSYAGGFDAAWCIVEAPCPGSMPLRDGHYAYCAVTAATTAATTADPDSMGSGNDDDALADPEISSAASTTTPPANCNWVNLVFVISASSSIDDPDGPSQGSPGNFEALKCYAKNTVQDLASEIDAGTVRVTVVRYADTVDVLVKASGNDGANPWLPASTVLNEINKIEYTGSLESTGAALYPTGADAPLALQTVRSALAGDWGTVGTYMVILSDGTYWHASPGGEVALVEEVMLSTDPSAHRIAVQIGARDVSQINDESRFLASSEDDVFSAANSCSSAGIHSAGSRIASLRRSENEPLGCSGFTTTTTASTTTSATTTVSITTASTTTASATTTTTTTATATTTTTGTSTTGTTSTTATTSSATTTTRTVTTVTDTSSTGTKTTATTSTASSTTATSTSTSVTTATATTATATTATATTLTTVTATTTSRTFTTSTTFTLTTTSRTFTTSTTFTLTTTSVTTTSSTSTTLTTATATTVTATTTTAATTTSSTSSTTTSVTTSTDTAEIEGCLLSKYAGPFKGARGAKSARIGGTFSASSKEGCATRCSSTPRCVAISWNWRKKRCEMYSKVDVAIGLEYGNNFDYFHYSGRCKTTTTSTTTSLTATTSTTTTLTETTSTATASTTTATTATVTSTTTTKTTVTTVTSVTTTTDSCPGGFPDPPVCANITADLCSYEQHSLFGVVPNADCPALCGTCTTTTATLTTTTIGLECILDNFLGPLVGDRGLPDNRLGWYAEINGTERFIGWTALGIESVEACGVRCVNTPRCTAFSFRENKRGMCEMYSDGGHGAVRAAARDYRHYFVDNTRCRDGELLSTSSTSSTTTTTATDTQTTSSATTTTATATTATTTTTTATATTATATTTSRTATTRTATTATVTTRTITTTTTSATETTTTHCTDRDVEGACKLFMPGYPCTCRQCKKSMYLHDGRCLKWPWDCTERGLVAVGEAAVGRACIKDGGICTIILGCTPPKSLSFCLASTVSGTDAPRCVECAETTWLVDGKCKPKLYCRGSYYAEGEVAALGKCTCRRLLENGGVDKNCGRCEVRKEPALAKYNLFPDQEWEHKGLHKSCVECTNGFHFYKGKCIPAEDCPEGTGTYSFGKRKSSCEAPFICIDRKRQWVDEADHSGEDPKCKCADKSCSKCSFPAGVNPRNTCIVCKHHKYLLDGECVTAEQCIASGKMAHENSKGPRGHVCI